MTAKTVAAQMLDKLRQLDQESSRHFYEMGQILHSFRSDKLYKLLGYDTFPAMVEEELSFGVGTAQGYAAMYAHFKRLHYTQAEAHDLLYQFGLRNMQQVLRELKTKVGVRAIQTRLDQKKKVISFWLDENELKEVQRALVEMGGVYTDYTMSNSSQALLAMARVINAPHNKKAA